MKILLSETELKQLSDTSINILTEVIKSYEVILSLVNYSRLYKIYIVGILNDEKVDFMIVKRNPDDSIHQQQRPKWSIKKEDCPLTLIRQLELAKKDKNSWVGGHPCTVIDIPKEVRDYIMERSLSGDSGVKNKLLHWIRSLIK